MIGRILATMTVALFCVVWSKDVSYDGYKVYRVQTNGEKHMNDLLKLTIVADIDFWSKLSKQGKSAELMVSPLRASDLETYLHTRGMKYNVLIDNVQSAITKGIRAQAMQPSVRSGKLSFTKFNTFNEINNYIKLKAIQYPNIASIVNIGQTFEGRELNVIQISTDRTANKPIIFIDAGIHAREWIAPAVAAYAIHQLIENKANRQLLDKVDWHILPVLNPDGYEYTHSVDRLWRKTRSKGQRCDGTDGNRNFDFYWGGKGTSSNECSDIYKGPKPSSELETQALNKYLLDTKNIKLYLSFHSYGNYILYPWGYAEEFASNDDELKSLGELVAKSMNKVLGNNYTVGSSATTLYVAAGGSDDWAKGVAGIELAYTIELSGGGEAGFDPPPSSILQYVAEGWEGIKTYHSYIEEKFGIE